MSPRSSIRHTLALPASAVALVTILAVGPRLGLDDVGDDWRALLLGAPPVLL